MDTVKLIAPGPAATCYSAYVNDAMLASVVAFSDPDNLLYEMSSDARLVSPENESGKAAPVNWLSPSCRYLPRSGHTHKQAQVNKEYVDQARSCFGRKYLHCIA